METLQILYDSQSDCKQWYYAWVKKFETKDENLIKVKCSTSF